MRVETAEDYEKAVKFLEELKPFELDPEEDQMLKDLLLEIDDYENAHWPLGGKPKQ